MTIMSEAEKPFGRAAALLDQLLDLFLWADHAPRPPVTKYHDANERRKLRRAARRSHPLVRILCEWTVRRDEMTDRAYTDFKRIKRELDRILEENDPREIENFEAFLKELERAAIEAGPESRAGRRFEHFRVLGWFAEQHNKQKRRQKGGTPKHLPLVLFPPVGAGPGASAPAEPVPYGSDSRPRRVFLRRTPDGVEWIAFNDGLYEPIAEICDLPDGNELVVSAKRKGYVVHGELRTLIEEIDTEIVEVLGDEEQTLLVIQRDDGRMEGFGPAGRLWTTEAVSSAALRNVGMCGHGFYGEAPSAEGGWVRFHVNLETGEVRRG